MHRIILAEIGERFMEPSSQFWRPNGQSFEGRQSHPAFGRFWLSASHVVPVRSAYADCGTAHRSTCPKNEVEAPIWARDSLSSRWELRGQFLVELDNSGKPFVLKSA